MGSVKPPPDNPPLASRSGRGRSKGFTYCISDGFTHDDCIARHLWLLQRSISIPKQVIVRAPKGLTKRVDTILYTLVLTSLAVDLTTALTSIHKQGKRYHACQSTRNSDSLSDVTTKRKVWRFDFKTLACVMCPLPINPPTQHNTPNTPSQVSVFQLTKGKSPPVKPKKKKKNG